MGHGCRARCRSPTPSSRGRSCTAPWPSTSSRCSSCCLCRSGRTHTASTWTSSAASRTSARSRRSWRSCTSGARPWRSTSSASQWPRCTRGTACRSTSSTCSFVLEVLLVNQLTQYKFAMLHKLAHDIQPLYRMVHLEHHICKGIYPNTSSAGLWEFWLLGGTITFGMLPIVHFPYLHFTMIYFGANVLVHTMWPSRRWVQWHTLHHIVLSDVYNVNIPSEHDKLFSKDVKKYEAALAKESLFVQLP